MLVKMLVDPLKRRETDHDVEVQQCYFTVCIIYNNLAMITQLTISEIIDSFLLYIEL